MFELMIDGVIQCLTPINILFMFISVIIGIIIGALPGFGAATGLIIILPLTYTFDPGTAFVALTGVYLGAEYGGSISSILINTPGTGGAVVTCFDGFPMAKAGKARDALLISNIASFSGGLVSALTMLFFMPILAVFALEFGAGEILILALAGLLLVGSVSKGDPIKGMLSAGLGVFVTCIGADSFMGYARFDFNSMILIGGIPFIPVMLGVFSVPHLLNLALAPKDKKPIIQFEKSSIKDNFQVFKHYFKLLFSKFLGLLMRSGFIGVVIGMIPGVGGSVATMVAYSTAKKASKHPEEFGHGSIEGIAAPEASNNGLVGGSLIPVLALGIPGSPAAAIFMGAIFMHGMTPGPNFMLKQADLVYLLIMAIFLCSFIQLFLGLVSIGSLANILKVTPSYLFPSVLVICSIGAYVVRGLDFDIFLFAGFGLAAYFLTPLGFNPAAFILGMILGNITERSFMESYTIASAKGGFVTYFLSRELALVMLGLLLAYGAYVLWKFLKNRKTQETKLVEVQEKNITVGWNNLRIIDTVIGCLVVVFAVVIYILTEEYPDKSSLFPRILAVALAIFALMLLARTLVFSSYYADKTAAIFGDNKWKRLAIMIAICTVYLLSLSILGFYASSFCVIIVLCGLLNYWEKNGMDMKTIKTVAIFSCVFIPVMYIIFAKLFMIQAPSGLLL